MFYQVFLTIPAQAKCRKQQERITLNSLEKIDAIPPNVKKKRGKHTKVPKVEIEELVSTIYTARQFRWLECQPVTLEVVGSKPIRVARARQKLLGFLVITYSSIKTKQNPSRRFDSVLTKGELLKVGKPLSDLWLRSSQLSCEGFDIWRQGQKVKSPAFHAGVQGALPCSVTKIMVLFLRSNRNV